MFSQLFPLPEAWLDRVQTMWMFAITAAMVLQAVWLVWKVSALSDRLDHHEKLRHHPPIKEEL
jgi:hypothetical protein